MAKNNGFINNIEFEKQVLRLESFPKIIFVETTRNCNLKCSMCERALRYGNAYNDDLNMDEKTLLHVAEILYEKAEIVDYHGNGEFLCYPLFFDAINLALKHDCKLRTVTNLCTTDKQRLEALANHFDFLCVSLDSPYKDRYELLRIGAKYELVTENLKFLVNRGRTDIIIMMTIAFDNLQELCEMIKLVATLGINKLYIWQRFLPEEDDNNIKFHLEDAKIILHDAVKTANKYNVELRMLSWPQHCNFNYDSSPCIKPWMSIHINYDGEVGICDFNETPDDFKGLNINEQSFLKIWNSKKYIELRKRHVSKEYIKFCSDFCIGKRFVDFEEILYLPKKQEIVSGEKILSIL